MNEDDHTVRSEWMRSVMARYEGPLTRYASRLTGDLDRGRDIVQDTFLRLCETEPSNVNGHLAEWLFTVCRNRALDVQRKESRLKPLDDAKLEVCESTDPSPSLAAERSETTSLVLKLVESLPANQQEVVLLKFQNGLSYREISGITKLSVSNVGFLIHTAIKNLRGQMQQHVTLAERLEREIS
jgi:RNA polymerase sigma-70 factor (ECF subfamily)